MQSGTDTTNRKAFFKLLAAINTRLFIPHRISVEFSRNRATVIQEHTAPHRLFRSSFSKLKKDLKDQYGDHAQIGDMTTILEKIDEILDADLANLERLHASLPSGDVILEEFMQLIQDEIGEPYDSTEASKEYCRRKTSNIPPFCKVDDKDKEDEDRRIGDVVIWLELLEKLKTVKKPLIFVTDDNKENWWMRSGGRKIPQPSLYKEVFDCTGQHVVFYSSDRFSESGPRRLKISVPPEFAKETKQIGENQQEMVLHSSLFYESPAFGIFEKGLSSTDADFVGPPRR